MADIQRFSVLESDGENNYLYDYQTAGDGSHYCTLYVDGEERETIPVSNGMFERMKASAVDLNSYRG